MPPVAAPTVTPTPSQTTPTTSGQNAPPPPPPIPFPVASRVNITPAKTLPSQVLGTNPIPLGPIELPAQGWSAGWCITVTGTTAGNAAAVAFNGDAPFNVIQSLSFDDALHNTIEVAVDGYLQFLKMKYGALSINPPAADMRADPEFSVVTGAGATGGSFKFRIYVYPQLDPVNAYGALPNLSNSQRMSLSQFTLNTLSALYATEPTNPPTVTVQIDNVWWRPGKSANAAGVPQNTAPYGAGTQSLWNVATPVVAPGKQTIELLNVGNVIRCIILVLRTATGARTDADFPGDMQLVLNNDLQYDFRLDQWETGMAQAYGYDAATKDVANGLDTGVYVYYPLLPSRGGKVDASGPRSQYLPTMSEVKLELIADSFGANASKLTILTNSVKPASDVPGMEIHAMYATGVV